ncbi:MAG: HesA/MoeB/ThiF family protein [Tannerellaceae bacterium]|nr:HesA/MoeB/ThiF family protein [Tannerellaceae bacterium]
MDRFLRNILIKDFGTKGQEKLKHSRILVIGAGGLGSPVLYYLAAAGIGTIGIVEYDQVDITNLQRQIIHFTSDLERKKVISAAEKLQQLYPGITIECHEERFTPQNATALVEAYDFIIDCCDNYETKFLINDTCVALQKPFSHAAVLSMQGEVTTYVPGHACYRCIFGEAPATGTMPTSAEVGILGSVAGITGSIQATEAIKYLTGIGELLTNRLLTFDAVKMTFTVLDIEPEKTCSCSRI